MAGKGILGRKLGMTQVWDADNRVVPVTVIQAGPCRVVQLKTPERDGYAAVQLAFGATKPQRLSKGELGHLAKAGVDAQRDLVELRVEDLTGYEVGMEISADIFGAGERVDVTGVSKGKGFAGVMKRHNFKGQGASHGNHKSHRVPGAIGACATPARVFKGTRMAGQMGARKVTTLNLEVVEGDAERGLLLIRGSIPGANGTVVMVRNAVKGPKVTFEPPAAREPVVEEPVADEAPVEEAAEAPVAEAPVPDEPAPDGPVADEAKADEPAADADDEGGASE